MVSLYLYWLAGQLENPVRLPRFAAPLFPSPLLACPQDGECKKCHDNCSDCKDDKTCNTCECGQNVVD